MTRKKQRPYVIFFRLHSNKKEEVYEAAACGIIRYSWCRI
ncbi:hypothetical protein BN439_1191 [Erwinia amylovora Ea644]|nr:hypothetical protein BN439_1191 [Erwinia amylovora Ea644]